MKLSCRDLHLKQGAFSLETSFEISGQAVGIFGNSGAGKTTLMELIAGLRRPSQGRIAVDDQILTDANSKTFLPPEQRSFGYIPQDLALFPHLSVRKNLLYGQKDSSAGITLDHVISVLEIEPLLDRSIADLSGGQKQRVAFARALLSSPQLLLMDEPLASLDHDLKLKIIPYLQRIRDEFKIPLLYVSHSPDEVVALCDQVIVMRDGKCVRTSRPTDIFEPSTSMTLKPGVYGNLPEGQPPA
jgi:molybdate transport system ATP-binding protein